MATAALMCRPHGKRSAQARSWKPGRRRQPSGARERWKPGRGETPQAARCATRTTARPAMFLGRGRPAFNARCTSSCAVIGKQVRQRLPWSGRAGTAGSAVFEGRQASRGGIARRAFLWRQAQRAAPRRGRVGITPSRQDAGWIPIPASTAMTSPAGSAHRARTAPKDRQAGRTR